jgi:hypothetical protein
MWLSQWLRRHQLTRTRSRQSTLWGIVKRPPLSLQELEPRTVPSFLPPIHYATGLNPTSVASGDFTNNGLLDLVVVNGGDTGFNTDDSISLLLGNGNGTFQAAKSFSATNPYAVAVGDFNGDGNLDLVVTNWEELFSGTHGTVTIYLGNGDGTFLPGESFDVGKGPSSVAVGDFTGNGILDLAVTNQNNNSVSILLGNGDGTFEPAVEYGVGTEPEDVVVTDLNHDGNQDLVVADTYSGTVSVLLGNGDGTFQPRQAYNAGPNPLSLAVGDFNGDGQQDLASRTGSRKRAP